MPTIKPFADFKLHKAADSAIIEKYENILHKDIINIWKEYGFGSFAKGFLKTINPDEYQELLNETYICNKPIIPIMTTGLGDIILSKKEVEIGAMKIFDIDIVQYRYGGDGGICSAQYLLENLADSNTYKHDLEWDDFLRAVKKYNITPEYDECYGYTPFKFNREEKYGHLENMGMVKNLKIVNTREYILKIKEKIGVIKTED
jgi:hypothetical protein